MSFVDVNFVLCSGPYFLNNSVFMMVLGILTSNFVMIILRDVFVGYAS
jgi:hypothetical protein